MQLQNKTIAITRNSEGNRVWKTRLEKRGAKVYALPTIKTVGLPLLDEARKTLQDLAAFDWLLLTSEAGVYYLRELIGELGIDTSRMRLAVATIGPRTTKAAVETGLNVSFQPSHSNAQALGLELPDVNGKKILLLQSAIAPKSLAKELSTRGGLMTVIPTYNTLLIEAIDEKLISMLQDHRIDFLTFASPSAVRGFMKRTTPQSFLAFELPTVAIGPTVASALTETGFKRVYTSKEPSINGIIEVLEQLTG